MTLKHGSLFSGIGMIDYGLETAGIETAWQVEIDAYCQAVLKKHWPDVKRYGDVKQCKGEDLERIDILSGGFPCTDISIAGHGPGIGTPEQPTSRSGLWFEFRRLISEIRPTWVIVENVARLCHTDDGSRVLSDLAEEGYAGWPIILGTEILGTPHPRPRTWIVACNDYPNSDGDIGQGVGPRRLSDNFQRAFTEAGENFDYWKRQLGAGNDGEDDTPEESPSAAYSRGVRTVYGSPHWVDRVKCCGNSVVWLVPALLGAFIVQIEEERATR